LIQRRLALEATLSEVENEWRGKPKDKTTLELVMALGLEIEKGLFVVDFLRNFYYLKLFICFKFQTKHTPIILISLSLLLLVLSEMKAAKRALDDEQAALDAQERQQSTN
jgi:hypothetical protein